MSDRTAFSKRVCEKLKFYVYLYIDPRTNEPFYIGKGNGNRCFAHLKDVKKSGKTTILKELTKLGKKPKIELLKYNLSEQQALLVEATAIDLLGLDNLTNSVRGFGSRVGSRATIQDVEAQLSAKPAVIDDSVILINVPKFYRSDIDTHSLYDATRSAWKVSPDRRKNPPDYALSVYRQIVREVFKISGWLPAGTTMKLRDIDGRAEARPGRWEFVGQVADEPIRRKYVGRNVSHLFKLGSQNPVMYVNGRS